jgi:AsmA protein
MGKVMKWGGIALGAVVVLIVGAVVLVPMFVDVQKYKPEIEALVTKQTGRTFSMGDDIKLSVFPWVGVQLTDLALGNADGFDGDEMISVKRFEVRLKVMPLFSRQIQVDTFLMDSPQIRLVKNKAGKGNWEDIGPAETTAAPAAEKETRTTASEGGMPISSLMVGTFSITGGQLSFNDQAAGNVTEIADLNLDLKDISLDKPVTVDFSATLNGKPLSLSGTAGPIGAEPGKSDISLDLVVKALDALELRLKGKLIQPATAQKFDLAVDLAPFSPRKMFEALGQPFPVETTDPAVLNKVAFKAGIKGDAGAVAVSGGSMTLDDSTLTFTANAKDFQKPNLAFDLNLDAIDADRYLPPASQKQKAEGDKPAQASGNKAKTDYTPLRKMVLDGKATIGNLKVANMKMANVTVHLNGKNGVFDLDPFSMDLYQGTAGVKARVDVRKNTPVTAVTLKLAGIQAGPMIKDAAAKEVIEGTLAADVGLTMTGDTPERIKKTLGGKGELTFTDGAIVGIDIAGTIRNAAAGLGVGEKPAEKPKTDFAELKIPYQADKGLVSITGASLTSPLLRLLAQGNTHLVTEELDFRIEPKLVATLKGQGDTKDRSGLLIPLLVTGTWNDPKVRPDLKGMVKDQLSDPNKIKELIDGKSATGEPVSTEDKAKGLLKGFIK